MAPHGGAAPFRVKATCFLLEVGQPFYVCYKPKNYAMKRFIEDLMHWYRYACQRVAIHPLALPGVGLAGAIIMIALPAPCIEPGQKAYLHQMKEVERRAVLHSSILTTRAETPATCRSVSCWNVSTRHKRRRHETYDISRCPRADGAFFRCIGSGQAI